MLPPSVSSVPEARLQPVRHETAVSKLAALVPCVRPRTLALELTASPDDAPAS